MSFSESNVGNLKLSSVRLMINFVFKSGRNVPFSARMMMGGDVMVVLSETPFEGVMGATSLLFRLRHCCGKSHRSWLVQKVSRPIFVWVGELYVCVAIFVGTKISSNAPTKIAKLGKTTV